MKSIQKSKRVMQLVAALFLTLGCVFAFRVQADAAITTAPAGVKQTDATSSQALVEWSPVLGTAGEQIYYYVMYSDNVNFTNYTISYPINCYSVMSGLSAGKTYYVKVGVSSTDQITGFPADTKWSGVLKVVTAPSTIASKGQAAFSWKANKAADGYQYEIYKYNSNKKLATGYTTTNSVTVNNSKLKTRQYYKIRVRAYVTVSGNKKKFGAWSAVDYFARSGGDDVNPTLVGDKVKLTWKKVAGAQSYTVYWSTSASGRYTKLTTTKSTSYTINKNIPYYKTYYVRVVPNRKVGKKNYTGAINSKSFYSTNFYKYQTWY